jgi:tetratricopeptide (TPR) repeat protein
MVAGDSRSIQSKMTMVSDLIYNPAWMRPLWLVLILVAVGLPVLSQVDKRQTALSFEQLGMFAEAESAWSAIAKAHPSNPEPLAHLGLLEAHQEHYSEAIAYYRKAMRLDPTIPGLRLNMGLALFKAGEYQQAIQTFEPLLKTQTDGPRVTILIGMAYYALGEYGAAVPYLRRAAGLDSQNLPLLLALGHSCLLSKQFRCVVDVYKQIVSLNAESAEADMLGGEALDEMKDTIGATEEFRAAVKADPKEPNVHFGLGYLLWTQYQYHEAAREFQAELDNDPEHSQAMLYLADADIKLNQIEDARPLLEKLIRTNPTISMAHLDLGIVYSEAGFSNDALRELQVAARLAPGNIDVHWRMGRLYRSMGRTAEAMAEFEKTRSLNKTTNDRLLDVIPPSPVKVGKPPGAEGTPIDKQP